jgi:hypothetical protein
MTQIIKAKNRKRIPHADNKQSWYCNAINNVECEEKSKNQKDERDNPPGHI